MRTPTFATGLLMLLATSGPARAQERDPWFAPDKALHFTAGAGLALFGYTAGTILFEEPPPRLALGAGLALGLGIGKELYDLAGNGHPSWKDLTWDALGTATGLLLAWTMDELFFQPDRPPRGLANRAR